MHGIASLWSSSSLWECVEYFAEATVVFGALFEVLADFELILKGDDKKDLRKQIEKWAAIALVNGLAIGLGALVRTNELFTDTIASLYVQARDADNRARAAIQKAGDLAGLLKTEQETTARFQMQASLAEAALARATTALKDQQEQLELAARKRESRAVLLSDSHISEDPRVTRHQGQECFWCCAFRNSHNLGLETP